jgi:hypothetical protein
MANTCPTPENPLELRYTGHIPALKNRKRLSKNSKTGKLELQKNFDVKTFLTRIKPLIQQQWEAADGELLEKPKRIGVYVEIVFYRSDPTKLPASDGDNSYTTIQETLKQLVVRDDNQVGFGAFEVMYTPIPSLEQAVAYIWHMDEEERGGQQYTRFWIAKQQREQATPKDVGVPGIIRDLLVGESV